MDGGGQLSVQASIATATLKLNIKRTVTDTLKTQVNRNES